MKRQAVPIPRCRRKGCDRPTVLGVCRACATPDELAAVLPHPTIANETIPVYPPLPDHYADLFAADPRVLRSIESC